MFIVWRFLSKLCNLTISKYNPFFNINSEWLPSSATQPWSSTNMTSALWIVESRWATAIVVRPRIALSRVAWTNFSLSVSSALVASSRRRILGLRISARAIASRCFWPPLRSTPLEPTEVLNPSLLGVFCEPCATMRWSRLWVRTYGRDMTKS